MSLTQPEEFQTSPMKQGGYEAEETEVAAADEVFQTSPMKQGGYECVYDLMKRNKVKVSNFANEARGL